MEELKLYDENQVTLHPPSSNSSDKMVESSRKGSEKGDEEAEAKAAKTKKRVRFEGCTNTMILTKAAATMHTSNKVFCLCAPTTHVGSFKCRLHRTPPKLLTSGKVPQPSETSTSKWMFRKWSTGQKLPTSEKISQPPQTSSSSCLVKDWSKAQKCFRYSRISEPRSGRKKYPFNVKQVTAEIDLVQLADDPLYHLNL